MLFIGLNATTKLKPIINTQATPKRKESKRTLQEIIKLQRKRQKEQKQHKGITKQPAKWKQ